MAHRALVVGALLSIIEPLERQGVLVARPRALIEREVERFYLAELDGQIIGCAALYPFPEANKAELACLAVNPDYRREGYGERLMKAIEMAGYLRANVMKFPALEKFHKDIDLEMKLFKIFLNELESMGLTKELLGTLTPLMADHMTREETYYLLKLSETTDLPPPKGDPTKPRVKS